MKVFIYTSFAVVQAVADCLRTGPRSHKDVCKTYTSQDHKKREKHVDKDLMFFINCISREEFSLIFLVSILGKEVPNIANNLQNDINILLRSTTK